MADAPPPSAPTDPTGDGAGAAAGDETVHRILDGALAEFVDIGIRRATVGSVARRAGVAPATIYRRVGQREELVDAVVAREVQRTLAEITTRLAPVDDPAERMVEGFVAALRLVVAHPLIRRILELEPDSVAAAFTTGAGGLLALGRAYVADQLRGDDATAVEDPDAVAELLVRFAHSLVLTPAPDLDDDDRARAFARAVLVPIVT